MPIYEYVCEMCGALTTKLAKPDVQDIKCPVCDAANAHRVPSVTAWRPDKTVQDV